MWDMTNQQSDRDSAWAKMPHLLHIHGIYQELNMGFYSRNMINGSTRTVRESHVAGWEISELTMEQNRGFPIENWPVYQCVQGDLHIHNFELYVPMKQHICVYAYIYIYTLYIYIHVIYIYTLCSIYA